MKKLRVLLIVAILLLIPVAVLAHSGRTDSNGGHYNRSTGEYHYHHGYPAHQHPNGVCPYEKTSSISSSTTTKTSTSSVNVQQLQQDNATLNKQVADMQKTINQLTQDKSTLDNQVAQQQRNIDSLNEQIKAKQNRIGELNAELDKLKNNDNHEVLIKVLIGCIIACVVILLISFARIKEIKK